MTKHELEQLGDQFARAYFDQHYWPDILRNPKTHSEKALYYYQQALELEPNNALLLSKIANQLRNAQALEYVDRALNLEPGNLLFQKQRYHFLLQAERWAEALEYLEPILSVTPDDFHVLTMKTKALEAQTEFVLEDKEPNLSVTDLVKAAVEMRALGRGGEALAFLYKALELEPDNKEFWTMNYWWLHQEHYYHEAEAIPSEKLTFKHKISIKEVFQTGRFGPVELGMNKAEVIAALGEPDDYCHTNNGYDQLEREGKLCRLFTSACSFWCYGNIEFFFDGRTDILARISLKHLPYWRYSGSRRVRLDPWIFRRVIGHNDLLTREELIEALNSSNIRYQDGGFGSWYPHFAQVGRIVLENDVEILYEIDDDSGGATIVSMVHLIDKNLTPW